MKKIFTAFTIALSSFTLAQNVGINSTGATAHTSALLDVDAAPANDKGLLVPRVTLSATNNALPITAPATSLVVYNTATAGTPPNDVVPGFYYWDGAKWIALGGDGGKDWSLTGNAGTVAGTNFIGTKDSVDLVFYTNNAEKARITAIGNLGVGTSSPNTTLDISGSVAFRETTLTLANGNNDDLNIGNNTFINISGPALAFAITGIAGGTSGRLLTLYNSTAQPMTISNQSSNSTAANRIVTLTGADITGIAGNGGSIQLQYSASASRWIVVNSGQNSSGSLSTDVVELAYELPSATDGGTATAGAWVTRALNVELTDINNICTLSSNQFTIPPGTYIIEFEQVYASYSDVQMQFKSRLWNVTTGTQAALSLASRAHMTSGLSVNEAVNGKAVITITVPTTFELQYKSQSTLGGAGLGIAAAFPFGVNERFAYVFIQRIAN